MDTNLLQVWRSMILWLKLGLESCQGLAPCHPSPRQPLAALLCIHALHHAQLFFGLLDACTSRGPFPFPFFLVLQGLEVVN
jgi:hypothetical protein